MTSTSAPGAVGTATRTAARAVVALSAAEVAGKVATLLVMVVAARTLGSEGFGAFSYALALALVGVTLLSWGYDTVLTRDGARDRQGLELGYADLVVLRLLLTAAALAALVVVQALQGTLLTAEGGVLLLLALSTALDTVGDAARAAAAAIHRQTAVAGVLVVQRLVTAAVALAALGTGGGLVGLGAGFAVGSLVGTLVLLAVVRRLGVRLDLRLASRTRSVRLVRDSFAIGVNSVVSTALFRVDAVLLGALAGTAAVGRYAAAYRLLETVLFVTWAIARAVFPAMAAASEPWQVRRAVERGVQVCAFVFVPYAVLLVLRGEDLMHLLYGPEFAAGALLAWLAPAPLLFGIAYLSAYALYAVDRAGLVLAASALALAVNVAVNLVLVPRYGDVGAAATTSASYALEALVLGALLQRAVGRLALLRAVLLPLLAAVPAVAVLLVLPLPVLVAAVLESVVYLATWLALSLRFDPEGVAVLRSLGRRS